MLALEAFQQNASLLNLNNKQGLGLANELQRANALQKHLEGRRPSIEACGLY